MIKDLIYVLFKIKLSAVSVGRLLMDQSDAESRLTVFHALPPKVSDVQRDARLGAIAEALESPGLFDPPDAHISLEQERVELKSTKATKVVRAIVSRTRDADLLILGSSRANWLKRTVVGRKPYRIARRSACPVIMVSPETHGVRFSMQRFFQFFREEPER